MLSEQKNVLELADAWGMSFARAYAEFVRALTQGSIAGATSQPKARSSTAPSAATFVEEVAEAAAGQAAKRAMQAHEAYLAADRAGTAHPVEFDPAVPAKAVGSRLKQIFKERGIKQTEIARRLGVAPSVISRVFKHPERSRLQTIRSIADAAGISLGELV